MEHSSTAIELVEPSVAEEALLLPGEVEQSQQSVAVEVTGEVDPLLPSEVEVVVEERNSWCTYSQST